MSMGVLPSQTLREMTQSGAISADHPFADGQIQPASIDLRLGARGWRVRASFLSGAKRTVAERLKDFEMHEISLDGGAVLEKGCVYVVPLMERLDLSADSSSIANARGSSGRLDIFTRLITDHGDEFDRIDAGYTGPLYAEISPRSFSVLSLIHISEPTRPY